MTTPLVRAFAFSLALAFPATVLAQQPPRTSEKKASIKEATKKMKDSKNEQSERGSTRSKAKTRKTRGPKQTTPDGPLSRHSLAMVRAMDRKE